MPNMSQNKTPMPTRAAEERIKTFDEVSLGYTAEDALAEAERCIGCPSRPCVSGCPVSVDIPGFIAKLKQGDPESAYEIITAENALPAICGRVCPQESQCEKLCVRGRKGDPVAIGRLERYAADCHLASCKPDAKSAVSNGKKVAVIGSGPSGLTCAGELVKKGYEVTIFEALHVAGGVLVYGIPEFRLPKKIVEQEIEGLKKLGVNVKTNVVIGKTLTIDDIFNDGYGAVFIGSGAGLPRFMNIKGENLNGVYSANEFLTRINLMKSFREDSRTPVTRAKRAVVVGGGNVAMDAARCAKRIGAEEVYIVYRRSESELPARLEEIEHAKEEGIIFKFLSNPVEITGDENSFVNGIKCVEMELGEPDQSGRPRPVVKEGSEFFLEADSVIIAIGTSPNPLIRNTTKGLETERNGGIAADETGKTSREGVFAGGDAVTGAATAILAMGAGKIAADQIDKYLSK